MLSAEDCFQELHKIGKLESMLIRLFVLEQSCYDVEFLTRCLYKDWNRISVLPEITQDYYLECPVKFSNSLPEPDNGETAWLDLTTSEAQTA